MPLSPDDSVESIGKCRYESVGSGMPKRFPKLPLFSARPDQLKIAANCIVKKKSLLRHIPDGASPVVNQFTCERSFINEDCTIGRCDESHDEIGKSRLSAARRTNHRNRASRPNDKIYLGERVGPSLPL